MKPLVLIAALTSVLTAQDAGLKARELFYTPPPDASQPQPKPVKKVLPARPPVVRPGNQTTAPVVNVANVPLGLRYSVMKREGSGKFAEVDQDSTFRSGDRIRLNVDTAVGNQYSCKPVKVARKDPKGNPRATDNPTASRPSRTLCTRATGIW